MNVVININDLLFHSKGSKTDSNGRYPVFFTNTHKLVMNYVHKNKGNTCHVYVNKRRRLLIVIGNNRNLEIKRMIDYIISKNKETGIIIYHIIRIFYGYCDNIEDIIQSIAYLRINIPYIHSIINYQVNHNIKDNIYAGFHKNVIQKMESTLNLYNRTIQQYRQRNPDIFIIPSRISDRNFDMFLCNCIKMFINEIDGYYYDETKNNSFMGNGILLNEIIHGKGKIVPSEICLFQGYTYLEDKGQCKMTGGTKIKRYKDYPNFTPNLSPKQIFQAGAFGGTYYRPIHSRVTNKSYTSKSAIKEYPKSWFQGLDIDKQVISSKYDKQVNKYKVKCGSSLKNWEDSGWIHKQDPYGWFQWYCRFYRGRRTNDDQRQIGRWLKLAGPNGRFRRRLMNMIIKKGSTYNDETISPVIRQVLFHWGYELTLDDFNHYKKSKK